MKEYKSLWNCYMSNCLASSYPDASRKQMILQGDAMYTTLDGTKKPLSISQVHQQEFSKCVSGKQPHFIKQPTDEDEKRELGARKQFWQEKYTDLFQDMTEKTGYCPHNQFYNYAYTSWITAQQMKNAGMSLDDIRPMIQQLTDGWIPTAKIRAKDEFEEDEKNLFLQQLKHFDITKLTNCERSLRPSGRR